MTNDGSSSVTDAGAGADAASDTRAPDADEPDGVADAGNDACAACTGAGMTCTAGACNIDCAAGPAGACANKAVCAPGLDCRIDCNAQATCVNVTCAPGARSCSSACTVGSAACSNIACTAPRCIVACTNAGRCSGTFSFTGGDAGFVCSGNMSCDDVTSVTCDAGNCLLECDPNSCPASKTCAGATCTGDWNL